MSAQYLEFTFSRHSDSGPKAILSLKAAGDMKFDPNRESDPRRALFASLGIAPERVVGIRLNHTRNVAFIESRDDLLGQVVANLEGFDGIVTQNPMLVPSVTVADCMPIYLRCERCGAFGVLHSGWKGTGILKSAVEGMGLRYGCKPTEISVILGPSIGSCCYAVDGARAKRFAAEFGPEAVRVEHGDAPVPRDVPPRYYLDLLAANRKIAANLGLVDVTATHRCTSCDPRLSSYRRDGAESFQRMLALAVCPFPN